MTLEAKKQKLSALKNEIQKLELEINQYQNYVPLKIISSGIITIKLHPQKQYNNLIANGWTSITSEELEDIKNYLK